MSGSIYIWEAESANPKYARFFGLVVDHCMGDVRGFGASPSPLHAQHLHRIRILPRPLACPGVYLDGHLQCAHRCCGRFAILLPRRCGQLQVRAGHLQHVNDFRYPQLVADKWLGQEQIEQALRATEGPEGPTYGYC